MPRWPIALDSDKFLRVCVQPESSPLANPTVLQCNSVTRNARVPLRMVLLAVSLVVPALPSPQPGNRDVAVTLDDPGQLIRS